MTVVESLIVILAKYGPQAYLAAKALLAAPEPTKAMWDALDAEALIPGEELIPKKTGAAGKS
jgi:hypothetical protein